MKHLARILWLSTLALLSGCGGETSDPPASNPPPAGSPTPPAQYYTVVHAFKGGREGAFPNQGLIRDAAGNLYGTAAYEGDLTCPDGGGSGCGTIFKLDSSGAFTTLYVFAGGLTDGALPNSGLVRDTDGNLYGTTVGGGAHQSGTVFRLDAAGTETVLYHFTGGIDGQYPTSGLVRDAAGNLYGTTQFGGKPSCPSEAYGRACGTVFKLDLDGTLTVLHAFAGGMEGWFPQSLMRDAAGNLYGVTAYGGDLTWFDQGFGTVFKVNPAGSLTTLHAFGVTGEGVVEGEFPDGPLIQDESGNFYGTTVGGGRHLGGIVFKFGTDHQLSTLHSFIALDGGEEAADPGGQNPSGGLIRGPAGVLYGTTANGGKPKRGVAFKLNVESGKKTVLYTFQGHGDGGEPNGGLVVDNVGSVYGTTSRGGDFTCRPLDGGCGVVFKIKLP